MLIKCDGMSEDIVNREKQMVKKLENKIKNPEKEFVVASVSRRELFYMLGRDEEALSNINSLSDEEIQDAINNMNSDDYLDQDELFYKLSERLVENIKNKKVMD